MGNLTLKLNEVQNEALLIIRQKILANNGLFAFSNKEAAFDEEANELTEDFLNSTLEFTGDTQWDSNETLYLLCIKYGRSKLDQPQVEAITQSGEVIVLDILNLDVYVVCEIADWLNSLETSEVSALKQLNIPALLDKFAMYQLNFDHDFVAKAFASKGHLTEHLQSKFNHFYAKYSAQAAFIMFWADLDAGNRIILAEYIINK